MQHDQQGPRGRKGRRGKRGHHETQQGAQGIAATTTGMQGFQGTNMGEQGLPGLQGMRGTQAVVDEALITGYMGPVGMQALYRGPQGFTGNFQARKSGPQGMEGTQQGKRGPQGGQITGLTGFQGEKGVSIGPSGLSGAQGVSGFNGAQGFLGESSGAQGARGPQGSVLRGAQGYMAVAGLSGIDSQNQGAQGLPGPSGNSLTTSRGPQGLSTRGTQGESSKLQGFTGSQGFIGALALSTLRTRTYVSKGKATMNYDNTNGTLITIPGMQHSIVHPATSCVSFFSGSFRGSNSNVFVSIVRDPGNVVIAQQRGFIGVQNPTTNPEVGFFLVASTLNMEFGEIISVKVSSDTSQVITALHPSFELTVITAP